MSHAACLTRRLPTGPALGLLLALGGCGEPGPRHEPLARLEVDVFADTGRGGRLRIVRPLEDTSEAAPQAAVWLMQISPAGREAVQAPLPEAAPGAVDETPSPRAGLPVDPGLKPPIPRAAGRLALPKAPEAAQVELDVRVDELGAVTDVQWAGGSADTALVRAATECALSMSFHPALQAGRPVAVWCRQRFDFGRRSRGGVR